MQNRAIAISIIFRTGCAQEWQALLQAASWRAQFTQKINIYLFIPTGKIHLLHSRVISTIKALDCQLIATDIPLKYCSDAIDAKAVSGHPFNEDIILVCRAGLLVRDKFNLENIFKNNSKIAILAKAQNSPESTHKGKQDNNIIKKISQIIENNSTLDNNIGGGIIGFQGASVMQNFFLNAEFLGIAPQPTPGKIPENLPSNNTELNIGEYSATTLEQDVYRALPFDALRENVRIVYYDGSSELYKSGLNKYASEVLSTSKSGFKNLMDLLNREAIPSPDLISTNTQQREPFNTNGNGIPFVVIGAMRTGSNLLQDYLNQCEGVRCYGELFNPAFINSPGRTEFEGIDLALRNSQPTRMLGEILGKNENCQAVGFRFFDNHLASALSEWLKAPRARALTLTRDPLESFISLQNALATNQWLLKNMSDRKISRWIFDPSKFLSYCKEKSSFYQRMEKEIKAAGVANFHIRYRELNNEEILNGMAVYLNSRSPSNGFKQNIVKQIDRQYDEIIINHEEVSPTLHRARIQFPNLDWNV